MVRTYSEPLYYKVRHIVLYHDDANDVLQNAFIKVWNHLSSFRGQSSLATWLYRIAINEALDFIRKQKQTDACSYDELGTVANRLLAPTGCWPMSFSMETKRKLSCKKPSRRCPPCSGRYST